MATSEATKQAALSIFTPKDSGGSSGGGGGSAVAGLAAANPYSAAIGAVADIANSPPPSSAASMTSGGTYNPKNINVTGLNLGSILQPYQGSPNTGGYGYELTSPLGGATVKHGVINTGKYLKYGGIGLAVAGGIYIIIKLRGR